MEIHDIELARVCRHSSGARITSEALQLVVKDTELPIPIPEHSGHRPTGRVGWVMSLWMSEDGQSMIGEVHFAADGPSS